ncbi:MAG TPA: acyl-ACP desaturase [Pyrinomonadaceae bacterium]|nr:acyl-ACP desaturase [Pyrinomonadaceae bacterium]
MFETEKDVLDWYEAQPRALTGEFLDSIEWDKIREQPLDPALRPVIVYMRDVESFTSIYHEELLRTPTGKSRVIKRFMERWSEEENDHAELLNRFLAEAGHPTSERWQSEAKAAIPFRYTFENRLYPLITNCFGKYFSGAHMVWGAINEMTTLQGYRRLWELSGHPVLEQLLRAIAREESVHSHFYWSIARLKLEQSGYTRAVARFVVGKFWSPVGQGTKPQRETDYVISTLFKGEEGVEFFERNVNERLQLLPGFFGLENVSRRIARIAL